MEEVSGTFEGRGMQYPAEMGEIKHRTEFFIERKTYFTLLSHTIDIMFPTSFSDEKAQEIYKELEPRFTAELERAIKRAVLPYLNGDVRWIIR